MRRYAKGDGNMILTDQSIRKLVQIKFEDQKPLIENFREESLQSESYDLSVGEYVYRFDSQVRTLGLDDQSEIDKIYCEVSIKDAEYILQPKEYILVSIDERINLPDTISAHIRPRTRFTRLGLIVSDQHCNSSYCGNLKIGLYNATNYAIKIRQGIRIAQMIFEELKEVPSNEKLYRNKPKTKAVYHAEKDFLGAKMDQEILDKAEKLYQELLDGLGSK